jgi:hypothetical protein
MIITHGGSSAFDRIGPHDTREVKKVLTDAMSHAKGRKHCCRSYHAPGVGD